MKDVLHDTQCIPLGVLIYRLHKGGGYSVPDSFTKIQQMVSEGLLEYRLDHEITCVMVARPVERN